MRRLLESVGLQRRRAAVGEPAKIVGHGQPKRRGDHGRCLRCNEDALMREVVGFIQLACALTLGMAGGWAVHQMGVVMGWSGF
jgi:hypothetical protein